MALSDWYLEDLFRIYMNSREALDRPPHTPSLRDWRRVQFGTDETILAVIVDKLRVKRREGAVDVLGWYIRFLNDVNRIAVEEFRRRTLRVNVRQPRVFISDGAVFESGISDLVRSYTEYERQLWTRQGANATESNWMGESTAAKTYYSAPLGFFIDAIESIKALSLMEAYQPSAGDSEVIVEVDFKASRAALAGPQRLESTAPETKKAYESALSAWNAIQPRRRAALAGPNNETSERLDTEYEFMHRRRGIPIAPR